MAKTRSDRGIASYPLADGSTYWMVRVNVGTRTHTWKGFRTKPEARHWYEDRKRDLREGRPFPARGESAATLQSTIERYLSLSTHKKGFGNERNYAAFWVEWYARQHIEAVTPLSVEHARIHLLERGATTKGPLARATVNRYVSWLKHVLMGEEKQGRIARNPCRAIDKFKERKAPEAQFSEAEELALKREMGEDCDAMRLAILTGLRQGEQFKLRWDQLDFKARFGQLPDPKSGDPEIFSLSQEAIEILLSQQ